MKATLLALAMSLIATNAAARRLELTFDDGPSGSGTADGHAALDNMETLAGALEEGKVAATFVGIAARSELSGGRYGRAADFPGGQGAIEASPWTATPTQAFSLWLRPRDFTRGRILEQDGSWYVELAGGVLRLGAYRPSGAVATFSTGLQIPADAAFHHLAVVLHASAGQSTAVVTVDFESVVSVTVPFVPALSAAPLRLGRDYDGWLDEVVADTRAPSAVDRLDFDPDNCPSGTTCLEEVLTMVPRDFPHEVPVRFKTIFDPARCHAASPCPVIFDVSGGSKCADDYSTPGELRPLALQVIADNGRQLEAGFVVVAVDLYCEGGYRTNDYPQETSQLIRVKDYVLNEGPFRGLIAGPEYAATGCSHGAGTVQAWAMQEVEDYPARSFARSTGSSGLCAYYSGYLCPDVADYYEQEIIERTGTDDPEDPRVQALHDETDTLGKITPELVRTREVARSWGVNTSEPICNADGTPACNEEGLWAMTYASRRFRDLWERTQPTAQPSGYFVEDHSSDCQHCAPPTSEAFRCGACMVRYGRLGMEAACPECLTYEEPSIDPGAPAEACDIPASWYVDPLAPLGPVETAGTTSAATLSAAQPIAAGCTTTQPLPWPALALLLGAAGLRSRRRAAGSCPLLTRGRSGYGHSRAAVDGRR